MKIMGGKNGAVICGFYGNYNLGDEALLSGLLRLFRSYYKQDLQFTVFSNDPKDTESRYSVRSLHRLDPKQKFERNLAIYQNQNFILGGGDLLRDTAAVPIALNWLRPLQSAVRLRRRTFVLGISVGEICWPETKLQIPKTLNKVDIIAVRDSRSKAELEKLGVYNTVHIMGDLALYDMPNLQRQFNPSSLLQQPIQVGISIRHLSGRGPNVDESKYKDFQQAMAAIIDSLVVRYGAIVHCLPFRTYESSYHPTDDDYVSLLQVLRYCKYSEKVIVHRYFKSLNDLKLLIENLNVMIGMRLHSLILAAGLGVPIIGIEYDLKVKGFMEEIRQSDLSFPINSFSEHTVFSAIEKVFNDQLVACQKVREGIRCYKQRTSAINQVLEQVISKS
jgi:polysaccharide pyruvyl transferase CsaB